MANHGSAQALLERCRDLAASKGCGPEGCAPGPEATSDADSLIGFFQLFRPDGEGLEELFEGLDEANELAERLEFLFRVSGNSLRPQGGRDVYFIVRNPPQLSVEQAEHHATQWLEGLRELADFIGEREVSERLEVLPGIRVLEGLPPKHPRDPAEQAELLRTLQGACSELTAKISGVPAEAALLRQAYYFTSCDAMLRDFLMWPFHRRKTGIRDPFRGYFMLWSHGVKYRVFREDQIDLYVPRPGGH